MIGIIKIEQPSQMKKALQIRKEVFVKEQHVPKEEEYDEFDNTATHFLAIDNAGNAFGTARWRRTENGIKLERFAILKDARGKGIGSMLLESILEDIAVQNNTDSPLRLYLHAQTKALPLYKKFGFQKEGEAFEECGIEHYRMSRML